MEIALTLALSADPPSPPGTPAADGTDPFLALLAGLMQQSSQPAALRATAPDPPDAAVPPPQPHSCCALRASSTATAMATPAENTTAIPGPMLPVDMAALSIDPAPRAMEPVSSSVPVTTALAVARPDAPTDATG